MCVETTSSGPPGPADHPRVALLPMAAVIAYPDPVGIHPPRGAVGAVGRTREPVTNQRQASTPATPLAILAEPRVPTSALR